MQDIIRNKPVAKFYYRGSHSHPVRRTVLITETDGDIITGYEIREGNEIRAEETAPVKSFRVDRIATYAQLRTSNPSRNTKKKTTTLQRESMTQAAKSGV